MKLINKIIGMSVLTVATMAVNASELGAINSYHELIQPAGQNAVIEVNVTGTTNDQGVLLLPTYEDGSIASVTATEGNLVEPTAKLISVHGRDVWAYQFANADNNVSLTQQVKVKNIYKEKKAKVKDSHPADMKRISYEFVNTAPMTIAKYSGALSVPQGKELYGVVTPKWSKKKKTFDILQQGNWKVVEVTKSKLKPGNSVEFKIRTYQPSPNIEWTLWGMVIVLSGVMLWRRRDILNDLSPAAN